jgi:hypothetical protein
VAYGKTRFYRLGEEPRDEALKRTGEKIDAMFPAFLQSRWWSTSTPLYRRRITDVAGPWTNLRNEEDWEYDCRIAAQNVSLHYCDVFVSDTRLILDNRISANGSTDPHKLADRAKAHALIFAHAMTAKLSPSVPEMQHFARELFLLSRQCGAAGLAIEARDLFALAREASGPGRDRGIDFRLYRMIASAIGWSNAGRLACQLDRLRP